MYRQKRNKKLEIFAYMNPPQDGSIYITYTQTISYLQKSCVCFPVFSYREKGGIVFISELDSSRSENDHLQWIQACNITMIQLFLNGCGYNNLLTVPSQLYDQPIMEVQKRQTPILGSWNCRTGVKGTSNIKGRVPLIYWDNNARFSGDLHIIVHQVRRQTFCRWKRLLVKTYMCSSKALVGIQRNTGISSE